MLIGLFHAPAVDLFHFQEVDKCTKHGLHRTGAYLAYLSGIFRVLGQLLMHAVVIRLVDALF